MAEEGMVAHAAELGRTVLGPGLRELAARHRAVGDVRGLGALFALELVVDRDTREPMAPYGGTSPALQQVLGLARDNGLLLFANHHRLHVAPPLNLAVAEAEEVLAILDRVLDLADTFTTSAS